SAEGDAVADVDVLLVALVGEVGAAAEGERGADLGGAQRPLEAVQPQGEVGGGPAGPADRAAVDPVDVDGPPDGVVGDPGGALDEPGVAGAQAAEPDAVAVGQDGHQRLDPQVEPPRGQVGGRVAAVAGGGGDPRAGQQGPDERVAGRGLGGGGPAVAAGHGHDLVHVPAGVVV